MVAADRGGVFRILENAGNFTPEEVATALELIDEWLDLGEHIYDARAAERESAFRKAVALLPGNPMPTPAIERAARVPSFKATTRTPSGPMTRSHPVA